MDKQVIKNEKCCKLINDISDILYYYHVYNNLHRENLFLTMSNQNFPEIGYIFRYL